MNDTEIVARLRRELAPVIGWYRSVLEHDSPDNPDEDPRDYLYDETCWKFEQRQSRGSYQAVIEALL